MSPSRVPSSEPAKLPPGPARPPTKPPIAPPAAAPAPWPNSRGNAPPMILPLIAPPRRPLIPRAADPPDAAAKAAGDPGMFAVPRRGEAGPLPARIFAACGPCRPKPALAVAITWRRFATSWAIKKLRLARALFSISIALTRDLTAISSCRVPCAAFLNAFSALNTARL